GAEPVTMRRAQAMLDSQGLVFDRHDNRDPYKMEFCWNRDDVHHYGFQGDGPFDLLEVVRHVKPTVLIGTTATPGVFSDAVIREMARHVDRPIIMPLSNPTSRIECSPYEAFKWTDGRAIVATGSPFSPLEVNGSMRHIGQANNVYIFPGIGLGAILAETREVTDSMFLVAAEELAACVGDDDLAVGRIYPDQSQLRRVARAIAAGVIREARQLNVGRMIPDQAIDATLDAFIWFPEYGEVDVVD
ncbi:MAG TPA: malic enzyme-like NAD(P)-binding protein, partial [Isosphaeraceae bacterium]|nr:malic enzyme-like NAD(P)-binding protein [Isosphaeraceae bacterium]